MPHLCGGQREPSNHVPWVDATWCYALNIGNMSLWDNIFRMFSLTTLCSRSIADHPSPS
jgi:hypothetical protein